MIGQHLVGPPQQQGGGDLEDRRLGSRQVGDARGIRVGVAQPRPGLLGRALDIDAVSVRAEAQIVG